MNITKTVGYLWYVFDMYGT